MLLFGLIALATSACAAAQANDVQGPADADRAASAASDAEAGAVPETEKAPTTDDAVTEDESAADVGSQDEQPATSLSQLFGLPMDAVSDRDVDQFYVELERETERRTALCMIEEGFEYVPVDYSGLAQFSSDLDRDSLAYLEQYGFGIATDPLAELTDAYLAVQNPNEQYLETLSPAESAAYYQTFAGMSEDELQASTGFITDGCRGTADADVYQVFGVISSFLDKIQDIDAQLSAQPEVIVARRDWAACMAEEGIVAESPVALRTSIREAHADVIENNNSYVDGSAPRPNYGDPVLGAQGPDPLTDSAKSQIDAVAAEEIRAAIQDLECGVDLRSVEAELRVELEAAFIRSHGSDVQSALGDQS